MVTAYQIPAGGNTCQSVKTATTDVSKLYRATQKYPNFPHNSSVIMTWPGNGHTGGANNVVNVYMYCGQPADGTKAQMLVGTNGVNPTLKLVSSYSKCDSTNANCWLNFTVPAISQADTNCTFVWEWQGYYTCADALVSVPPLPAAASGDSGSGSSAAGGIVATIFVFMGIGGGAFFIYKKKPELWQKMKTGVNDAASSVANKLSPKSSPTSPNSTAALNSPVTTPTQF
jgi:hypothetical protein